MLFFAVAKYNNLTFKRQSTALVAHIELIGALLFQYGI